MAPTQSSVALGEELLLGTFICFLLMWWRSVLCNCHFDVFFSWGLLIKMEIGELGLLIPVQTKYYYRKNLYRFFFFFFLVSAWNIMKVHCKQGGGGFPIRDFFHFSSVLALQLAAQHQICSCSKPCTH